MALKRSYTHSEVFEKIKATDEKIKDNYTSLQYLQTLDMFIWEALEPIYEECPHFFRCYIAKIVARQSAKASAKFSSSDRGKLPILLFNFLTELNPKKALEHVKDMNLNRGILFGLINLFLAFTHEYEKLNSPFHKLDPLVRRYRIYKIEQRVGLRPQGNLFRAIQQVRYWDVRARTWRSQIIEKYHRMTLNYAKTTYVDYNHFIPLDDVVQIFLTTMTRAIDRCNAKQGVLTTFIQNWLKSARSEVADLCKGQTDQSFETLSEEYGDAISEVIGFTEEDRTAELYELLAAKAKVVDKIGLTRYSLGIPEFLTSFERETLEMFVDEGYLNEQGMVEK
jgi:hypothetical protein